MNSLITGEVLQNEPYRRRRRRKRRMRGKEMDEVRTMLEMATDVINQYKTTHVVALGQGR